MSSLGQQLSSMDTQTSMYSVIGICINQRCVCCCNRQTVERRPRAREGCSGRGGGMQIQQREAKVNSRPPLTEHTD